MYLNVIHQMFCFVSQTRSLLSVFEEDSGMLTDYTNQLLQSMQRVFGAQVLNKYTNMLFVSHLSVLFDLEQKPFYFSD